MDASWPLVGRAEELAACERALGTIGMGGVVLAGAPGVGKTRLAREVLARAEASGCATWWVVASRAAASIPFGAVAHLVPPTLDGGSDRFTVLQRTGEWLVSSASGRRPVLGIDDAQWLDDGSAALIQHLTMTGVVAVVVTVRSGELAPDPVVALWKDGLAARVEVEALSRAETIALMEAGLGGRMDGLTAERLWQLSEGNALYLRELIRGGVDTGALVRTHRVWRWRGPIRAAGRLVELLEARIGNLPAALGQLVELVAFGEPLDVETLQQVGIQPATVEAAEAAGLLCSAPAGHRIEVRLAHPLFGEVLRARISPLRARAVYMTLTSTGAAKPRDALRVAVWHLNAGASCEPGLLVAGATAALAGFDYQLAERLARFAIAAGGSQMADQVLVEALVGQGHAEQAEVILAGWTLDDVSDAERAAVARTRALNLHLGLGRPEDAEAVLTATDAAIADPACRGELACLRAKFLMYTGRCADAVNIANEVLARPDATVAAVSDSLTVLCQSLTGPGKHEASIAAGERGVALERKRHPGSWSMAEHEIVTGQCMAYLLSGRLPDAEPLATLGYQRSVAVSWPVGTAVSALWLGEIGRARGELTAALRWFREAAALVRGDDFRHPYCSFIGHIVLGCFARAAAQAGEAAEAQAALSDADALARPSTAMMGSFLGPIHAWVAVASGEVSTGIELALKTAAYERHRGNAGYEMIALHDVVRLGAPARAHSRLGELTLVVEGRLAPLYASHAAALATVDGTGLDVVAVAFAELGYLLLAAEAATQAATAHRSANCRARAGASAARARVLVAHCGGARTPALASTARPVNLTPREIEIARLAAAGLSSRAIAKRLVVAVRTVDNTLGAAYAKLGVGGRDQLTAALAEVVGCM
ncbi:MAG: AAA family ATPase [Pseudonocardiaceae bacterium]